jgi:hypothetical protein
VFDPPEGHHSRLAAGIPENLWSPLSGDGNGLAPDIAFNHWPHVKAGARPIYQAGQGHDQAWHALKKTYPGQNEPMGWIPSGLSGSRYCCPLRKLYRRHVCQYNRLCWHRNRLDRAACGLGQNHQDVINQIKDIERSLPFPILGFDSDNGSEFLNHHLLRHLTDRKRPIQFTRSRAYKKDDNAHVEQKNWTHVRQWLGYDRLDSPKLVPLMNALYTSEWRLFLNFFCPSVKLLEKKRVASKTVKRYDKPKTPYRRVLESPAVSEESKRKLKELYKTLNPFDLRKALEEKLKKIFKP